MSRKKSSNEKSLNASDDESLQEYVTMVIHGQLFGIPVRQVQDVLGPQKINRIPLAPPEVAGSLNLRGRIVTAIDVRRRLGLPPYERSESSMSVVVEQGTELYSLIIDEVGEVLNLRAGDFERNPANLDPLWREVAAGIYQLDDKLMVVIDIDRLLSFGSKQAA